MIDPIFPNPFARVFGLKTKAANFNWKEQNYAFQDFDFSRVNAYGVICDFMSVIDFDDDKSRAKFSAGCLQHFLEADQIGTIDDLINLGIPVIKTPHGFHIYVLPEQDLNQSVNNDIFIDVRANGSGYVVGPCSKFESEEYKPLCDLTKTQLLPLSQFMPNLFFKLSKKAKNEAFQEWNNEDSFIHDVLPSVIESTSEKLDKSFDGLTTWRPKNFLEAKKELLNAKEGERNNIFFCCVAWAKKNRHQYKTKVSEFVKIAQEIGLTENEIRATLISAGSQQNEIVAKNCEIEEALEEDIEKGYMLSDKTGKKLKTLVNVEIALDCGDIDCSDFKVDVMYDLIKMSLRERYKDRSDLIKATHLEIRKILESFFDDVISPNLLDDAREMIEVKAEKIALAPEIFDVLRRIEKRVTISDIVDHLHIEIKNREFVERQIEACLLQCIRRLKDPGSVLDNVIILYGEGHFGKSTFIPCLFDFNRKDLRKPPINPMSCVLNAKMGDVKDIGEKVRGKWGVELCELASLKKSNIEDIKTFITQQTMTYRPSYGRVALTYPVSSVYIGTSNEEPTLKDVTGNRRFCIFKVVSRIDNEWFLQNREIIWASMLELLEQHPERAELTIEETKTKEKSFTENVLSQIPYAAEILDVASSQRGDLVTRLDLISELTDKDGHGLKNDYVLKQSIHNLMKVIERDYAVEIVKSGRINPIYVVNDKIKTIMKKLLGKEEDNE